MLNAVIKQALQRDEFGYLVKRADEDADPGMIGDRVVSDIINAELVVTDLTDLNPNVFYELGIRHSTEKPTIHVAKVGTALPFDNVAHRTIFVDLADWYSIENARIRLAESVRVIKGPDYKVSNPITQANASFKMRQSEDPRDQVIAQMNERLAALESLTARATTSKSLVQQAQHRLFSSFIDCVHAGRKQGKTQDEIEQQILDIAAEFGVVIDDISYRDKDIVIDTAQGPRYTVTGP
jgi:hypothetical protein